MDATMLIWIGGLYNLAFLIFHDFFWKIFNWKEDLAKLMPINRAIMQVLNLMLIFCLLIFAYISFFHVQGLLTTDLGKTMTIFIAMFWGIRAILQMVYFSRTKLVSYVFFVIFWIGFLLYFIPWLGSR
ncbi:MAG: hypothetical protein GY839_05080 [candidate division Zixibacteria bacterium]|nr:hypothetical protein [candidate division Zixibacteria bacterium]